MGKTRSSYPSKEILDAVEIEKVKFKVDEVCPHSFTFEMKLDHMYSVLLYELLKIKCTDSN